MQVRTVLEGRLAVVDGLLSPAEFAALGSVIAGTPFRETDQTDPASIWRRNAPLNPEVGPLIVRAEAPEHQAMIASMGGFMAYPTGTPLDAVMDLARDLARERGIMESPEEYAGLTCSLFSYGPGTRLSWHRDEGGYLGAFSAYFTLGWRPDQGGFLAYEGEDPAAGVGGTIEPRANRMVLIGGGLNHAVTPVASDAPAPRVSLSGFFIRKGFAERLIERQVRRGAA